MPENPYLVPIQVGCALTDMHLPGMLHDDTGDNISAKNKSFCELTAQYWAWKNADADYIGFFHYRRYLSFADKDYREDEWGNINYPSFSKDMRESCCLDPESMEKVITSSDVITVRGRKLGLVPSSGKKPSDIYEEYGLAPFQHREDLDIVLEILREKYPAFVPFANTYLHQDLAHECNMFIMRREIFQDYMAFLFSILFEAEKRIDTSDYDAQEYRVFGYLAERLCGIYCTWLKSCKGIRYRELPKVLIQDTEPEPVVSPCFSSGSSFDSYSSSAGASSAVTVVTSANNRFAPYLDVFLRSVIGHADPSRNYDILVLYDDITEQNRRIIGREAEGFDNVSLRFVDVSRFFAGQELFVNQHLSVETYYRLILPELLPDYHRILYLDCDLVVNRDVADLFDTDLSGTLVGAAADIDVAGLRKINDNGWQAYARDVLHLQDQDIYFQAGVLLMYLDGIRGITDSKKLIALASSEHFRCHDQDVMNIVCRGRVKLLSQQWNVLMNWREVSGASRTDIISHAPHDLYFEYLNARKEPYIVHYAGYQKPWNVLDCDFADYFWSYARQSLYYPSLIRGVKTSLQEEEDKRGLTAHQKLSRLQDQYFPRGSRGREVIDRIYMTMHRTQE